MKRGSLKSLGHNIADSFASGIGLMIGVYEMNVFAEASSASEGFINVDFLNASSSGGDASSGLRRAIGLYRDALPALCEKHGIDPRQIKTLEARYGTDPVYGPHFAVTVEDNGGRRSTDQYVGVPGKRLRRRRK
jgi:hypothetical protein